MSMESPEYRWRSAARFEQRRSKCSAVSSPVPQWGQTGDVICPMKIKAWYEAVDVSLLSLPWNTRRYSGAELTITASQMPVGSASRFALSRLRKFLVPWLHSELPQVLERWSHVNVCLWLVSSTSICRHLVCPFISVHSYMAWYPYQTNNIFRISYSDEHTFFPNFATNSFILKCCRPSTSCFNACILTAILLL